MKYSYEERLEIGSKLYHNELSRAEASEQYGISVNSARDYMRLYRDANRLPPKTQCCERGEAAFASRGAIYDGLEAYASMSKEELLRELARSKVNEARLKKGYMVKGVGKEKQYIRLGTKNTK